jgi:cellulose synthase/poly-beta-1,6-N-acetylglucosamine synthase-like glycosyltransferase
MDFWWILYIIDWLLFVPVAFTVAYILFFAIAALFKTQAIIPKAKRQSRYIILIPSYKSDKKILETVNTVLGQTYPQRNFDIVVISDHQNEMINMRLAQLPITLLTPNFARSTKVKALQYAILNLPQFKIYDAVILLDAGNIVDPEFVEQVNDAFESAGTKAIQTRRMARNLDTPIARMDSIFEEINNTIFRRGHLAVGLSASLNSSGSVFDFLWFKRNIMKIRSSLGEDKELEAMLVRDSIYIDYFDDIHVYDEKTRKVHDFNLQRGRWTYIQLHNLVNNLRFFPLSIMNSQYDLTDKIIQWLLIPRTIMMGVIMIMCVTLPFIYFTLALKWWAVTAIALFAYALATPDYLVTKDWDRDFLRAPLITIGALYNIFRAGRDETGARLDAFSHLVHKLKFKARNK